MHALPCILDAPKVPGCRASEAIGWRGAVRRLEASTQLRIASDGCRVGASDPTMLPHRLHHDRRFVRRRLGRGRISDGKLGAWCLTLDRPGGGRLAGRSAGWARRPGCVRRGRGRQDSPASDREGGRVRRARPAPHRASVTCVCSTSIVAAVRFQHSLRLKRGRPTMRSAPTPRPLPRHRRRTALAATGLVAALALTATPVAARRGRGRRQARRRHLAGRRRRR